MPPTSGRAINPFINFYKYIIIIIIFFFIIIRIIIIIFRLLFLFLFLLLFLSHCFYYSSSYYCIIIIHYCYTQRNFYLNTSTFLISIGSERPADRAALFRDSIFDSSCVWVCFWLARQFVGSVRKSRLPLCFGGSGCAHR